MEGEHCGDLNLGGRMRLKRILEIWNEVVWIGLI
jgi:hypothetical protein